MYQSVLGTKAARMGEMKVKNNILGEFTSAFRPGPHLYPEPLMGDC